MKEADDFTVRYDIVVEYRGLKVLDHRVASILRTIREKKSILGASKALGLPYSRVYDTVARIERLTGRKIINVKRGGRGGGTADLTDFGEKLLSLYETALRKLIENGLGLSMNYLSNDPIISIAHSYDVALPIVLSMLVNDGISVKNICTGSRKALAMLILELVDVACINLYDRETRTYNRSYLEKLWLLQEVELLGGYSRELVFVLRPGLKVDDLGELLDMILSGELVIVTTDKSSGITLLLVSLLFDYAEETGLDINNVRGLERELIGPEDVAKHVMQGKADVGFTLRYFADKYNLRFVTALWDVYECYVLRKRYNNVIHKFKNLLNSDLLKKVVENLPGYKLLS